MNKRQKKKLEDKLFFRFRKLHPSKGDVIIMTFDPDKVDYDFAHKCYNALEESFRGDYSVICMPKGFGIKQMSVYNALKYIEKAKEYIKNGR